MILMHTLTNTQEGRHDTRSGKPGTDAGARAPAVTVLSASVGGAAAAPIDPSVCVAPLRTPEHVDDADRRAAYEARMPWGSEPWDPWPPSRIGYGVADPLFPPQCVLDRLARALCAYAPRR